MSSPVLSLSSRYRIDPSDLWEGEIIDFFTDYSEHDPSLWDLCHVDLHSLSQVGNPDIFGTQGFDKSFFSIPSKAKATAYGHAIPPDVETYNNARIAWFMKNGWDNPQFSLRSNDIIVQCSMPVVDSDERVYNPYLVDGQHRMVAAYYKAPEFVNIKILGDDEHIDQFKKSLSKIELTGYAFSAPYCDAADVLTWQKNMSDYEQNVHKTYEAVLYKVQSSPRLNLEGSEKLLELLGSLHGILDTGLRSDSIYHLTAKNIYSALIDLISNKLEAEEDDDAAIYAGFEYLENLKPINRPNMQTDKYAHERNTALSRMVIDISHILKSANPGISDIFYEEEAEDGV